EMIVYVVGGQRWRAVDLLSLAHWLRREFGVGVAAVPAELTYRPPGGSGIVSRVSGGGVALAGGAVEYLADPGQQPTAAEGAPSGLPLVDLGMDSGTYRRVLSMGGGWLVYDFHEVGRGRVFVLPEGVEWRSLPEVDFAGDADGPQVTVGVPGQAVPDWVLA